VQGLLGEDEALVLFLDVQPPLFGNLPEETFVWVVTKSDVRWVSIPLGTDALAREVGALRCGLDNALWDDGAKAKACTETLKAERHDFGTFENLLPFDMGRAHALYRALLGPVEDLIGDKHLLIVPSGPLTSLPFNVLITEHPTVDIPEDPALYRDAAWLGVRQPITVLPSVASLGALRAHARASQAGRAYLGIGNPLLDGKPSETSQIALAAKARAWQRCADTPARYQLAVAALERSVPVLGQVVPGTRANIQYMRAQTPLPETAFELCQTARALGALGAPGSGDVLLGERATEAAVKDLSEQGRLAQYRIVHFATHAALAGQMQGLAEPGLLLTPPPEGTEDPALLDRDDGYLSASEIATLKLDADWVVLSACNTAGASGESAEALSGLARAFFYAGARTLLVSHWAVGSYAAVRLTTHAFQERKDNPGIGRAEAFRRSMREVIRSGSSLDTHPMQWAAFAVVGEGAR
jgi:CHAT domain-containing protein